MWIISLKVGHSCLVLYLGGLEWKGNALMEFQIRAYEKLDIQLTSKSFGKGHIDLILLKVTCSGLIHVVMLSR